jgi:peptidoglycan/xylan/chitin deacetylase (PgdA/CDA1 family)
MIGGIKSKVSFEIGRNPRTVARPDNFREYVPAGYDGVVTISADFELAWAWRYAKCLNENGGDAKAYAARARQNVPKLLDLCEQYRIPITWATVGHLFLDSCDRFNGHAHPEVSRPAYFENAWWAYRSGDWYDHDPCSSLEQDDAWYAPDLLEMIIDASVEHEIGCHTFSHIDCRDEACPEGLMRDELRACQEAASRFGIQLESFVFPGNLAGHFKTLKEMGYTSVRRNERNEIGYPRRDNHGLWHLPATVELFMNPAWSERYNLYRFQKIIDRTAKAKAVANLWFHPSVPCETAIPMFEGVFSHLRNHGSRLWVATMKEYTAWLNKQQAQAS